MSEGFPSVIFRWKIPTFVEALQDALIGKHTVLQSDEIKHVNKTFTAFLRLSKNFILVSLDSPGSSFDWSVQVISAPEIKMPESMMSSTLCVSSADGEMIRLPRISKLCQGPKEVLELEFVIMTNVRPQYKDTESSLVVDIAKLADGRFSDTTLVSSDNVKFPVHKAILCTRSSYFASMLDTKFVESKTAHIKLDHSANILRYVLNFIYTSTLFVDSDSEAKESKSLDSDDLKQEETLADVLRVADMIQLPGLFSMCLDAIISGMTTEDACFYICYASQHKLAELNQAAHTYIARLEWKDKDTLVHSTEFLGRPESEQLLIMKALFPPKRTMATTKRLAEDDPALPAGCKRRAIEYDGEIARAEQD